MPRRYAIIDDSDPAKILLGSTEVVGGAIVELEFYANFAAFPVTGTAGIMYIAQDTNKTYEWDNAQYEQLDSLSPSDVKTLYEGNADTNAFTDALLTKLNGVEANAKDDQTGAEIKVLYEAELDTNAYTDAEKSKLAGLESSRFKGEFASLAALEVAYPTASVGDYANVDAGLGSDVIRYVWDDSDSTWLEQLGSGTAHTAAEIKTLYESNADTNALTDAGLALVNGSLQRSGGTMAGVIDWGTTFGQHLGFYGTAYGLGVQTDRVYYRSGDGFCWFRGGVHADDKKNPGGGGELIGDLDALGNLRLAGGISLAGGPLVLSLGDSSGVGYGTERTLANLAKAFTISEAFPIPLAESTVTPIVTVTKETPLTGQSDTTWGVALDDTDYLIEDTAYDIAVTISANTGAITLTLASGTWATTDERKTFVGKSGKAVLIGTGGSAAIDAYVTGDFDLSGGSVALAGEWTLHTLNLTAGALELSGNSGSGSAYALPQNYDLDPSLMVFDTANADYIGGTSVNAQAPSPESIVFSRDGTKAFVLCYTNKTIYQYTCAIPWHFDGVSVSYDSVSFYLGGTATDPRGLDINDTNDRIYVACFGTGKIYEVDLPTPKSLTSAAFGSSFIYTGYMSNCYDCVLAQDGSKMFILHWDEYVYEFTLGTSWDVTSATYTRVSAKITEEIAIRSIDFNSDGTIMVLVGTNGDTVFQYGLTTGWDVSTMSYASKSFSVTTEETTPACVRISDDDSRFYMTGGTSDNIHNYFFGHNLYTSYTLSVAAQATNPRGFVISASGSALYAIEAGVSQFIYQYTLAIPHRVLGGSYASKSLDISGKETGPRAVTLNDTASEICVSGEGSNQIHRYTMSSAGDLATATFTDSFNIGTTVGTVFGHTFSADGMKLYVLNNLGVIYQFYTTIAWDISTLVYESKSFTVGLATIKQIVINQDGDRIYLGITNSDEGESVRVVDLGTAFDVSTGVVRSFAVATATQDVDLTGLAVHPDELFFYTVGVTNDIIRQYQIPTTDLLGSFISTDTAYPYDIVYNPTGTKAYLLDNVGHVKQYSLSTAYEIATASYDSVVLDISLYTTSGTGLTISPDGTILVVSGGSDRGLHEFTMTAWTLSSASFVRTYDLTGKVTTPAGIAFNGTGSKLFVLDSFSDKILRFSTPNAYSLLTISDDVVSYTFPITSQVFYSMIFNDDGSELIMCGDMGNIERWSLSTPFDATTVSAVLEVRALFGPGLLYTLRGIAFGSGGETMTIVTGSLASDFTSVIAGGPEPFPTYVANTYETALTTANKQILSGFWSDINSVAVADVENTEFLSYAFSIDEGTTWFVCKDLETTRSIVRNNAGIWEYNAGATYGVDLWIDPTVNTVYEAFRYAMLYANNVMNAAQVAAVTDSYWFEPDLLLDLARILHTDTVTNTPTTGQVTINYDTSGVQSGAVHGTDYTYQLTAPNEVTLTSLVAATLRVRVTGE